VFFYDDSYFIRLGLFKDDQLCHKSNVLPLLAQALAMECQFDQYRNLGNLLSIPISFASKLDVQPFRRSAWVIDKKSRNKNPKKGNIDDLYLAMERNEERRQNSKRHHQISRFSLSFRQLFANN